MRISWKLCWKFKLILKCRYGSKLDSIICWTSNHRVPGGIFFQSVRGLYFYPNFYSVLDMCFCCCKLRHCCTLKPPPPPVFSSKVLCGFSNPPNFNNNNNYYVIAVVLHNLARWPLKSSHNTFNQSKLIRGAFPQFVLAAFIFSWLWLVR